MVKTRFHAWRMRYRLMAYRDGELTPEQRLRLTRHLERCTGCAETLRQIEAQAALFRAAEPDRFSVSPDRAEAIFERALSLARPEVASALPSRVSLAPRWAVAGLVLMLCGFGAWQVGAKRSATPSPTLVQRTPLRTPSLAPLERKQNPPEPNRLARAFGERASLTPREPKPIVYRARRLRSATRSKTRWHRKETDDAQRLYAAAVAQLPNLLSRPEPLAERWTEEEAQPSFARVRAYNDPNAPEHWAEASTHERADGEIETQQASNYERQERCLTVSVNQTESKEKRKPGDS